MTSPPAAAPESPVRIGHRTFKASAAIRKNTAYWGKRWSERQYEFFCWANIHKDHHISSRAWKSGAAVIGTRSPLKKAWRFSANMIFSWS